MGIFLHRDDQIIIFADDGSQSVYPFSWWITQEPLYTTPAGFVSREYFQGKFHRVFATSGDVTYSLPWADGDDYIDNKDIYDIAYREDTFTLQQAKDYQIALLHAYADTIRDNGVLVSTVTYKSSPQYYSRWKNEHDYALRESALLTNYYVHKLDGTEQVIASVAALTDIVTTIDLFYWELTQIEDDHIDGINAEITVANVLAYDYTTGFPTTPFDAGL